MLRFNVFTDAAEHTSERPGYRWQRVPSVVAFPESGTVELVAEGVPTTLRPV